MTTDVVQRYGTDTDASRVAWNWYLSTLDEDAAPMTKPRPDAAPRTASPLSLLVTRARGEGATQCVVESSTAAPATYELWSLAGQRAVKIGASA